MAALCPPLLTKFGRWISEPSIRDLALSNVLLMLVELLRSKDSCHGPEDRQLPLMRATAFVPSKKGTEMLLVPHLRVTSADPDRVLCHKRDFESRATFTKGDTFVGQVWEESKRFVYQGLKAIVDFSEFNSEADDNKRLEAWKKQFQALRVQDWSLYMRNVRTIWTFAIPQGGQTSGEKQSNVVAVISIDAIQKDAFAVAPVVDNSLLALDAREAIATSALATYYSYTSPKQSPRGLLRSMSTHRRVITATTQPEQRN